MNVRRGKANEMKTESPVWKYYEHISDQKGRRSFQTSNQTERKGTTYIKW